MARKNRQQISTIQAPPVEDSARAEYTPPEAKARRNADIEDPNSQERGTDHVYSIASRDRWGGADSATLAEQHRDSRRIDSGEEDEEEEEETSAADLTVAQLKEALDEAGVEYEAGAKKADLVALHEANIG